MEINLPSDEELKEIAKARAEIHVKHGNNRPKFFEDKYLEEFIGLLGERQFSKEFSFPLDLSIRPYGDKGIDFITSLGTLDVKTFRKPNNMLVRKGHVDSDIYVLAGAFSRNNIELLGWEWAKVMATCSLKDFGYGIISHYKPAESLREMAELKELLNISPGRRLCDIFDNEHFQRIRAMTWEQYSADLVRRQREELKFP